MRFCDTHWNALRAAIDARGLGQFVSKDGAEALRRFAEDAELQTKDTFDPLIAAHTMIVRNGLRLLTELPNQNDCLLCALLAEEAIQVATYGREAVKVHIDQWIDQSADGALTFAKGLGLVATG